MHENLIESDCLKQKNLARYSSDLVEFSEKMYFLVDMLRKATAKETRIFFETIDLSVVPDEYYQVVPA